MFIGQLIATWRQSETFKGSTKHGIRAIAREIGISHGTLSRIENGDDTDGATMIKLFIWLFRPQTQEKE